MLPEHVPPEHRDLFGVRTDTPYTEAERIYSATVQTRLHELLAGERQDLLLLRRYHDDPERLAVMSAPRGVNRQDLRLHMVERILISTIAFVRDISPGGPVLQRDTGEELIEFQQYPTKYPHIVIERVDHFQRTSRQPLSTEWRLRRHQNQRAETLINRWLDTANLAISVVDTVRSLELGELLRRRKR